MTSPLGPNASPSARSFAEHVRSFHASLSEDEQKLLEKVFALAELAASSGGDEVQGFAAVDAFIWFERKGNSPVQSSLWNQLGKPGGGLGSVPVP